MTEKPNRESSSSRTPGPDDEANKSGESDFREDATDKEDHPSEEPEHPSPAQGVEGKEQGEPERGEKLARKVANLGRKLAERVRGKLGKLGLVGKLVLVALLPTLLGLWLWTQYQQPRLAASVSLSLVSFTGDTIGDTVYAYSDVDDLLLQCRAVRRVIVHHRSCMRLKPAEALVIARVLLRNTGNSSATDIRLGILDEIAVPHEDSTDVTSGFRWESKHVARRGLPPIDEVTLLDALPPKDSVIISKIYRIPPESYDAFDPTTRSISVAFIGSGEIPRQDVSRETLPVLTAMIAESELSTGRLGLLTLARGFEIFCQPQHKSVRFVELGGSRILEREGTCNVPTLMDTLVAEVLEISEPDYIEDALSDPAARYTLELGSNVFDTTNGLIRVFGTPVAALQIDSATNSPVVSLAVFHNSGQLRAIIIRNRLLLDPFELFTVEVMNRRVRVIHLSGQVVLDVTTPDSHTLHVEKAVLVDQVGNVASVYNDTLQVNSVIVLGSFVAAAGGPVNLSR